MPDPDIAESLEQNDVFVEYSMERFEHRISAPPRRISNRFIEGGEPDAMSHRCSTQRAAPRAPSSCSSSSSAPPSSPDSSSASDENLHDDTMSGAGRHGNIVGLLHINNDLADRLDVLQDDNAALQQQVRKLRASQFDNIVLATSAPAPPADTAINNVEFIRASAAELHSDFVRASATGTDYVRSSVMRGLSDNIQTDYVHSSVRGDAKLFDPLSIALFNHDELHPENTLPEMHSLRREITELSEDKRLLLEENHCLEKEKRVLEAALAKAQRDVEDAAISIVDKISPMHGKVRMHALDSDVQRLCNLSRLLGDENGRLRSQIRDAEAVARMLKEDMGEMKSQNSRLMIEMSSARAQKEVLEQETERVKEAAAKAGREAECERARIMEEVEGARRTMQGMREEEKRLINENVRLEREMGAVLESLEEFEERQVALRGEKQKAAADASQLEAELADALARVVDEVDTRRKAVERAERAEALVLELRQEAADLRFQMQRMAQELESEKVGREAALQEMALLRLRERALTQDIRQLVRTGSNVDVAGPHQQLMLLPASPRGANPAAVLESQLGTWLSERADLQEVDKDLQQQVEKLARGLSESLQDMEDELFKWKNVTAHLEVALRQARDRSSLCEKNAKCLLSHLLPPSSSSPSTKNALHAAAASGALAGFGLLAYAKLKKSTE